jgi:hypothetical protein
MFGNAGASGLKTGCEIGAASALPFVCLSSCSSDAGVESGAANAFPDALAGGGGNA